MFVIRELYNWLNFKKDQFLQCYYLVQDILLQWGNRKSRRIFVKAATLNNFLGCHGSIGMKVINLHNTN